MNKRAWKEGATVPCCPALQDKRVPVFIRIPSDNPAGEEYCRRCIDDLVEWVADDCQEAYGEFAHLERSLERARKIYADAVAVLGPGLRGYSACDLLCDNMEISVQTAAALAAMLKEG